MESGSVYRVTAPCCLRFVWISRLLSAEYVSLHFSAKQRLRHNIMYLHRHRLEICSMLLLLLFPAVGWFLLTLKTCDTPHTGRDGWPAGLAMYERNIHTVISVLIIWYLSNLNILFVFCFFFSRKRKFSTNCLRNMCTTLLTWLWMVLLMANSARNWKLLSLRQNWTW